MGFAIAQAARDRGAEVTLVTGPVVLTAPHGVHRIDVETTAQMAEAVRCAAADCDAVIMAAAPADFHPEQAAEQKIKRTGERVTVELVSNEDIIAGLHGNFVKVGFAAETEHLIEHARSKIDAKGLDFIVANDVTAPDAGFAHDTNRVTLIDRHGDVEALPLLSKYDVAMRILDRVARLVAAR
jgi:phosphopantothenoylcysteine decarboxylase/phosphopantothenate--cysteine ligase